MVGPGEVDEELQPEVVEECAKYGEVVKVVIYEVSLTDRHLNSPFKIDTLTSRQVTRIKKFIKYRISS